MTKPKAEPDPACSEAPLQPVDHVLSDEEIKEAYVIYYPEAVRFARSLGCSSEDAEDLAQRTMWKAFIEGKCKHFRSFSGWIRTTVRNDFRNMKRQDRFTVKSLDQEAYSELASNNPTIAETDPNLSIDPYSALFDNTDLTEWYKRVGLTEREIQVIEMRFIDGMSVKTIAMMMNMTSKKVSKILDKAKTKLRRAQPL